MWNKSWDVNVTGTYILTHTLIPLLLKSADPRILFITSGTATLTESTNLAVPVNKSPGAKGWPKDTQSLNGMGLPAYRSAKTGLNMMMRDWLRVLKEDGVKCWSVSPGMLATGLGMGDPAFLRKLGALEPSVGADFVRSVVEGERDGDVGLAVRKAGVQPW
jgi:NAD(P)-dependent dehydrogenase (short-subunit alcohol dehydrogenase family)